MTKDMEYQGNLNPDIFDSYIIWFKTIFGWRAQLIWTFISSSLSKRASKNDILMGAIT